MAGWEWDNQWEVEKGGHVDQDGWAYFGDFSMARYPPPPGAQSRNLMDFTRRRRIVRRRRPIAAAQPDPEPAAESEVPMSQRQQQREVVGVVEPGDSLPLPPSWRSEGEEGSACMAGCQGLALRMDSNDFCFGELS